MMLDQGLEFIQWVHQFRSTPTDLFFISLSSFDRQEFLFVLIPIIWINYGWKSGLRLSYILLLSSVTNRVLKDFFLSPRPFHIDPSVGVIQVPGFGFPSGAAQTVILLSGLLLRYWENSWKWVVASIYILSISFSRIYLGVHFPGDILGGWLVGFGLLLLFFYTQPPIERQLNRMSPLSLFLLSQTIPLFMFLGHQSTRMSSVAIGMGIGVFIAHSYQFFLTPPNTNKEYILRALVGVLGTFACYILTGSLLDIPVFLQFLLVGLWISLGSHLVYHKFFTHHKASLKN